MVLLLWRYKNKNYKVSEIAAHSKKQWLHWLGLLGMCYLLPQRIQCDVQQKSTNWVINLNQNMKEIYMKKTMHSVVSLYISSSSWSVQTHWQLTHIQQKRIPDKWYIHLGSYQCRFCGSVLSTSSFINCMNTQISKAVMTMAFESAQSFAITILPAANVMTQYFFEFDWKYFFIYSPYEAINYFTCSPTFIFEIF